MRIQALTTVLMAASAQWLPAGISPALFRHHYIAREMPGRNVGMGCPSLADFDRDGDLDFAVSNRGDNILYWFEYRRPDDWKRHVAGHVPSGQLGSVAFDVDRDGLTDVVIGGHWYRNPGNPRQAEFIRYAYDPLIRREIHDMAIADVDGDGARDLVVIGDREGCFWYSIPNDPAGAPAWPRTLITMDVRDDNDDIHSGFAPAGLADLDGDGDTDVVFADRWYENEQRGSRWIRHRFLFGRIGPWGLSSRSWVTDVDGDGDPDIIITDSDGQNSGAAWLENDGGRPPSFRARYFANRAPGTRGSFHSLQLADLDGDGDLDVVVVEQEDPSILPLGAGPRWFVWERTADKPVRFEERVIFDGKLGGHDVLAGDVDGDGDIDLVSKIWRVWPDNGNGGKVHADFFENLTR